MQQAECAPCGGLRAEQAMGSERRNAPRESVNSLVYVDIQPNNGGILLDLNASGMRISAAHPLRIAKAVRFSFGLSPSATIEGTGQVTWITESGKSAGICFVDLAESSLTQITQWLGSKSSQIAPAPNETVHTRIETPESQMTGEPQEIQADERLDPDPQRLEPFAEPSLWDDAKEGDQTEFAVKTSASATEEVFAPASETNDGDDFRSKEEWARETPLPWLVPSAPTIEQPAKSEEMAVPQRSLAEERGWILPAADETTHTISAEDASTSIFLQHTGMGSIADPARAEPEPVAAMDELNNRLPVYAMGVNSRLVPSTPNLASQVLFRQFREFGWGLERDWHVSLGTLLLVGGLVALWQHPPMLLFGIGLWIAGGLILTDRKKPPAEGENPGMNRNTGAN